MTRRVSECRLSCRAWIGSARHSRGTCAVPAMATVVVLAQRSVPMVLAPAQAFHRLTQPAVLTVTECQGTGLRRSCRAVDWTRPTVLRTGASTRNNLWRHGHLATEGSRHGVASRCANSVTGNTRHSFESSTTYAKGVPARICSSGGHLWRSEASPTGRDPGRRLLAIVLLRGRDPQCPPIRRPTMFESTNECLNVGPLPRSHRTRQPIAPLHVVAQNDGADRRGAAPEPAFCVGITVTREMNRVRLPQSDVSSCPRNISVGVAGLVNTLAFPVEVERPVLVEVVVGPHGP